MQGCVCNSIMLLTRLFLSFSGYYLLKCLESMGDVSSLPAFSTALKSLFLRNWKGCNSPLPRIPSSKFMPPLTFHCDPQILIWRETNGQSAHFFQVFCSIIPRRSSSPSFRVIDIVALLSSSPAPFIA